MYPLERALKILQSYWKHPSFRPMQEMVLRSVLAGKDVFAMMPTGGGKSICYQVPALVLKGTCLVISPLIALIEDQVAALQSKGIPAAFVHSGMDQSRIIAIYEEVAAGNLKLLYVSPERLQSPLFSEYAMDFNINLIAVDEAHCISQWGHDFRPAYRKISSVRELFPSAPVLALTATATKQVKEDIVNQLQLRQPSIFEETVSRPNLFYHLKYVEAKQTALPQIFERIHGTAILYCRTRKRTEEAAEILRFAQQKPVFFYHAGLGKKERQKVQEAWMNSKESIIAATTAFGMGIDKSDVRLVAHFDVPESIEQYYQEVGRAGRDGENAYGLLLYNQKDLMQLHNSSEKRFPPISKIIQVYRALTDFFQLGHQAGEGEIFAFDFHEFVRIFDLPALPTHSAIKILEREGFLEWNENANTHYTIRLTTGRDTIEYLEKNNPLLYSVLELLLRSYGSIYHFETIIDFFGLTKKLGLDKQGFESKLYQLQDLGVLIYKPAIVGSHILWLHPSYDPNLLPINEHILSTLKAAYEQKIESMIAFVREEQTCRNKLLSQYFGQVSEAECGHCDNCLRRKFHSGKDIKAIKNSVLEKLKQQQKPIPITELLKEQTLAKEQHLLQVIRQLIDEGAIQYDDGNISL